MRIYPTLDAVLEISRTREEGAWPRGKLFFTEQQSLHPLSFIARFPDKETPLLENTKHVRKLLTAVENSTRALLSDGKRIIGIIDGGRQPEFCVMAEFYGQYGYLQINNEPVCSFSGGNYLSTTHRACVRNAMG